MKPDHEIKYTEEDLKDHIGISAVIKDNQGRVLMQNHVKYGFWTLPVGKALPEQTVEDCLKEELFEECGINVEEFRFLLKREFIYDRHGHKVTVVKYLYEITRYSGEIKNKEPHKHSEQKFMAINEIKKLPHLSDATLLYLEILE